jgi:acetyl esterase/lipase
MSTDRRSLLGLGVAVAAAGTAVSARADTDPQETVRLWPGLAPGGENVRVHIEIGERSPDLGAYDDRFATGITEPILTVFRPAKPNGAALLIAPGGGYARVVIDKEGFECARRFAREGITCFVLRYRLPGEGWARRADVPLQDAQRAMRVIRAGAETWRIDPARVGVLGFSAGGHVAASLASLHDQPVYASVDANDRLSAKPSVAGLMYPVITMARPLAHEGSRQNLLGPAPSDAEVAAYSREKTVGAETPPSLIVHALDDHTVPVENSLRMLDALRSAKVAAELHLFEEGDHGFGLRLAQGKPCAVWPELFLAWLKRHGQLSA